MTQQKVSFECKQALQQQFDCAQITIMKHILLLAKKPDKIIKRAISSGLDSGQEVSLRRVTSYN